MRTSSLGLALAMLGLVWLAAPLRAGDFADAVVSYAPAPGQLVNNPAFNSPARALGAPGTGGLLFPDTAKLVTLGGFGGSIVLRFSQRVLDDPANPFGLDAIVFGNAFWVGLDPTRRFAEAGVIEISLDANANGLADDAWYVIPGSSIATAPPAVVPSQQHQMQAWDNSAGTSTPPANLAWYPAGAPPSFSTQTFRLPAAFEAQVLENPGGPGTLVEAHVGYADLSPTLLLGDTNADDVVDAPSLTPGEFYTQPDNPYTVGVTPGSGGGDAFDIAWAIDPATGFAPPVALAGFDFIRISTGVNAIRGSLGEASTEIGAVADVRPRASFFDLTADSRVDAEDLYRWEVLRAAGQPAADLNGDGSIGAADRRLLARCARRTELAELTP